MKTTLTLLSLFGAFAEARLSSPTSPTISGSLSAIATNSSELKNKIISALDASPITQNFTSTSACSDIPVFALVESKGIDADSEFLRNSEIANWNELCTAVLAWNARFPDEAIFQEPQTDPNVDPNVETLAALLGNANHESAAFRECGEKIQPCGPPEDICSAGYANWYQDQAWGQCYQVPVPTTRGFTRGGTTLPENACNFPPTSTCTDWNGRNNTGKDCWYGRGALQITWNCNYAKMNVLVSELNLNGNGVDLCRDPDSLCNSGEGFWATAIAFWMLVVHPVYKQDFSIETAMHCIKDNCAGTYEGTWIGSGNEDRRNWYNTYKALLN